jgi:hypothetical protein
MNVFELKSGRPRLIHPEFNDLAGAVEFPLWFIREVKSMLASKELYAIAAGVGHMARYTPFVGENYLALVETMQDMRMPLWHALAWSEGVATVYRKNVIESAIHEVDVMMTCLSTLQLLANRKTHACATLSRTIRIQRDDLESVIGICTMWGSNALIEDVARLDAVASSYRHYMTDDHRQGIDRRLNVLFEIDSRRWWGVKGTL